jgi:hypothetical protein
MPRLPTALACVLALGSSAGCGRTITDDDCKKIADNMHEVWASEAKKAAPPDGVGASRAASVLKQEGEKLTADWSAECKKELLGRRADPKEMECLLAAKSVDQLTKCAEL